MSKELKALNTIVKNKGLSGIKECVDIIETALKEKEQQDGVFKILKEVIGFEQMLPHIEPNKDNGFDIMSAVRINIQRDIENKERELLRQWVLETCFPKEFKELEDLQKVLDDFGIYNTMNLIDTLKNIGFLEKSIAKKSKALEVIKSEKLIIVDKIDGEYVIETKGYVHNLPKDIVDFLKEVLL